MEQLETLGLWGDRDEVCAIEDAFRAIEVDLPVEDAPNRVTVGDLWTSVCRVAPAVAAEPESWNKFRRALSEETGADWTRLDHTTTLLDGRGHSILSRLITTARERLMRGR